MLLQVHAKLTPFKQNLILSGSSSSNFGDDGVGAGDVSDGDFHNAKGAANYLKGFHHNLVFV